MADVTDLLGGAGREPVHPVDPADIRRRARRRSSRDLVLGLGGTSALVIALLILLLPGTTPSVPVIGDQPEDCRTITDLRQTSDPDDGSTAPDLALVDEGLTGWVLPFLRQDTWTAGREAKFAVKVDGTGFPTIELTGPDGASPLEQVFPNSVGSSSWTRPGDEYIISPTVPTPGCWELRIIREQGSASLVVRVEEPATAASPEERPDRRRS